MVADSVRLLLPRAGSHFNGSGTSSFFQSSTGNNTGAEAFIANLIFAEGKSVRTSTIILAAFNVLAAFATACSILYDCYRSSRRCKSDKNVSRFFLSNIHPAETFPLVLAIGIVIQGLVFAGVQGRGLEALRISGCSAIAQFMLPALFLVPYIQVVFGLECAIRSFKSLPFQARGKYDVSICLGSVLLMLIGTWIPSFVQPQSDKCFASLVWFVSSFGELGFVLLITTTGLIIICGLTIFIQLSRTNMIDQHQRIAASRMVYYLVLSFISLGFVLPHFAFLFFTPHGSFKAAMMAAVVLNLSGLMNGVLQLFLRSNTATSSFGPKSNKSWDQGKHEVRLWGPNELGFGDQLRDPVLGPRSSNRGIGLSRGNSMTSLIGVEKRGSGANMDELASPGRSPPPIYNPLRSNAVDGQARPVSPTMPQAAQAPEEPQRLRKQSYSLFPVENTLPGPSQPQPTRQDTESAISDLEDLDLVLPPTIRAGGFAPGHRRGSSTVSSATVQIGLRLSHAPGPQASLPMTTYQSLPASTYRAAPLPTTTYSPAPLPTTTYSPSPLPATSYNPNSIPMSSFNFGIPKPPRSPSPQLTVLTSNLKKPTSLPKSPRRPSPLVTTDTMGSPVESPRRMPSSTPQGSVSPTPRPVLPAIERLEMEDEVIQLSPSVYTPPPSRNGSVNRARNNSAASQHAEMLRTPTGPSRSPSTRSPTRPQRSDSTRIPARKESASEWI